MRIGIVLAAASMAACSGGATPASPPPPPAVSDPPLPYGTDEKALAAAAKEFEATVEASRAAITECYEHARATGPTWNDPAIDVQVTFEADGHVSRSSSSPSLGPAFDACVNAIAAKWTSSKHLATTFKTAFWPPPSR